MESTFVKLYSSSFIIVQPICKNLESQGIIPIVKDETESARLAGFGISNYGNQDIFVHQNEYESASKILTATLIKMGI